MRSDFLLSPKCEASWRPTAGKKYSPIRISRRTLRLRGGVRRGVTTVRNGEQSDGTEAAEMFEMQRNFSQ